MEHIGQGNNNLVSRGSAKDFTSNKHIFHEGDVLYGKLRPLLNKVYLAKEDGFCSTDILPLKIKRNILGEVLLWHISSDRFVQYADSTSSGTKMPRTNWNDIKEFKIALPSLKEQQKIASILSKVDELIQKTDQIIEQTQRLKKGLMQKLLTKGIGHTKFKKTTIGEIPEVWDIGKLGEALNMCQYGISEKISLRGQYPIFRMNNIQNGNLLLDEMKFIDLDKSIFEQYKLEKGDLLFNRTNSADLVGKVGLFNLDGEYTFASYLIRLRTINEKMNPFFLHSYLNTDWMQYRLKNLATPGVSQVNINATNLKSITIPIPSTSEQQEIVSVFLDLEDKVKYEKRKKIIIENLKKGLMQKLLTGKIRVKV